MIFITTDIMQAWKDDLLCNITFLMASYEIHNVTVANMGFRYKVRMYTDYILCFDWVFEAVNYRLF